MSSHRSTRLSVLRRLLAGIGLLAAAGACAGLPPTPLEQARFARISSSAEISAYLAALAAGTPGARVERIGASEQGRAIEALVLDAGGSTEARPRLKVMIVGSQHGASEPAGGEALLVLARELAGGPLAALRRDLDVILLPNANPDGRDLGRRSNANGVNINTDFVLATQAETRVLLAAVRRFAPDALLDSHESAVLKRETLGREGYLTDFEAQFEIANNPAVPGALQRYALTDLLPALTARVSGAGLRAHRYIGEITSTDQPITNGGLTLRNFRNMAGLSGAVSFLVETRLDSREDTFPTYRNIAVRVERQLTCLRAFLTLMHERREEIALQVAGARAVTRAEPLSLYAAYVADDAHSALEIPLLRRDTRERVMMRFRDHRAVATGDPVSVPGTYLVTRHAERVREILEHHAIIYHVLSEPHEVEALAERFTPPADARARGELLASERVTLGLEPGMLMIDLAQPRGRLVPLLLDPRSTSSVFRYPEFAALMDAAEPHFAYRAFEGVAVPR